MRSMKLYRSKPRQVSLQAVRYLLLFCLFSDLSTAQDTTVHTQSNVVLVPALVKDRRGLAVYGLGANDFLIEDDGASQSVRLDETSESDPVSFVILVQCGRKGYREFSRMKGLSSMLSPVLDHAQTSAALVEFDSGIHVVQEFTEDPMPILSELRTLEAGDDGAAIIDAVKYSVNRLNQQPQGRLRVLLLISEMRDHGSHIAKLDDVVTAIGEGNTVVYSLSFSPALSNVLDTERGNNKDEMNAAPDLLAPIVLARQGLRKNTAKTIAYMSGGEYQLFDTRKSFESYMNSFTNHLHSRYLLSFQPQDPHPGLHRLRVRLKNPQQGEVLARSSYWAQSTP
jgi:VWFA-related protein